MNNIKILEQIESFLNYKFSKTIFWERFDFNKFEKSMEYSIDDSNNITGIRIQNFDLIDKSNKLGELISRLEKLKTLDLSFNKLSDIPNSIFKLTELSNLYLGFNKLNILPNNFIKLINLKKINLDKNNFTNTIETLKFLLSMERLKSISFSSNNLTTFPDINLININLEELILNENKLSYIPDNISNIVNLETLSLNSNFLDSDLNILNKLNKLKVLELDNNNLKKIPNSILSLRNLEKLSFEGNSISESFENIENLKSLKQLWFDNNGLTAIPKSFKKLTNLEILTLDENNINTGFEVLGELKNLKCLLIDNNNMETIPISFINLKNLEIITLNKNNIKSGFKYLCSLKNLKELWLDDNYLTKIPDSIGMLENLEHLSLRYNDLEYLPIDIDKLKNLKHLDISDNYIDELPESITNLKNLNHININGNELLDPPTSIALKGIERIKNYFMNERIKMSICKMVVIGEGGAGKTSLLDSILGKPFNPMLESTHGINIETLKIPMEEMNDNLELIIWDFGGQDIYHATHQFYLTENSLFVLVWNSRIGYEGGKVNKWIETISALSPSATIIVVATHCMDRAVDIPKSSIKRKYPHNKILFYEVDNTTNHGISKFINCIKVEAASKKYVGIGRPKSWIKTIKAINNLDEKYIEKRQLFKLFKNCKVDKGCYEALSKYLHFIGEILYFPEEELMDTIIVKPEWLSRYIAMVLDSEEVSNESGFLKNDLIKILWKDLSYDMRNKCIRIMEKFDLSYRVYDDKGILKSLIVEKLKLEEDPNYLNVWNNFRYKNEISLIYSLSTIPAGIPTWFIARTHKYTTYIHWKRGVLLQDSKKEDLGLVVADVENKKLTLTVKGNYPNHFFSVLKDTLEFTFNKFPGLSFQCYVPCKGHNGLACKHLFKYEHLIKRITKTPPITKIECPESADNVNIHYLLYGIENLNNKFVNAINTKIEKTLNKNNQFLLEKINDISQLQIKQIQREFIKMFQLQQKIDEYSCPNIFTITKSSSKFNKIKYNLQLYCQNPENIHPVENAKYEVSISKEWFKTLANYYNKMIPFIKIPLMLGSPIIGKFLETINLKDFTWLVDSSKEAIDMLNSIDSKTMDTEMLSKSMTSLEGSELRIIHNILERCDPEKNWGGLERTLTSDGNILWLCKEHKTIYEY
ncbi:MAG: COR domain-containing protein [Clostridiales bacterium]